MGREEQRRRDEPRRPRPTFEWDGVIHPGKRDELVGQWPGPDGLLLRRIIASVQLDDTMVMLASLRVRQTEMLVQPIPLVMFQPVAYPLHLAIPGLRPGDEVQLSLTTVAEVPRAYHLEMWP